MAQTNPRGIFFDLDGTLIDSLPDIAGCMNEIRDEHGLSPLPHPIVRSFVGKGGDYLVAHALKELLPRFSVDELFAKYRAAYLKQPDRGGSAYPGVEQTLSALRQQRCILGIVTNKSLSSAKASLACYLPGVAWDVLATPETVSERKPNPKHLLEALAQVGVMPAEAWFVGDDPVDAACAAGANVFFLGASYGIGGVEVPPDRRLTRFSDLLRLFPHLVRDEEG